MNQTPEKLVKKIEKNGWDGRIVSIAHLAELENAVRGPYDQGLLDREFYRTHLSGFSFDPPEELSHARSIIIIAVPTPQMRIFFNWKGERLPVVVPPTYVSYTLRTERTRAVLAGWVKQAGYHLVKTQLPLKTLAVRSGLAEYGRNNICFVKNMGSFFQLVGAFSDLPCGKDSWRGPKALDRCETCIACLKQCPTGAITRDRFLLRAERCLTFHNEGADDFAEWIDPAWHHCLIGCMRCQSVCPENKDILDWIEDRYEFSEQETDSFVEDVPFEQIPAVTATKLKSMEINEEYRLLCRNLRVLIRNVAQSA